MDDADMAQACMETEDEARRHWSKPAPLEATATGECLWCGKPLEEGLRWCVDNQGECRDAWSRRRGA